MANRSLLNFQHWPGNCKIKHLRLIVAGEALMLIWALAFFIIAVIAAILGFGAAAVAFAALAKLVFYVAVVLFAISLIGHLMRRI